MQKNVNEDFDIDFDTESTNQQIHNDISFQWYDSTLPLSGTSATIDDVYDQLLFSRDIREAYNSFEFNLIHPDPISTFDHSSSTSVYNEPNTKLKKVAHNVVERRYRSNINDRIRELKDVIPALYKTKEDEDEDIIDGIQVAKKLNKATILCKATEYIQVLKQSNEHMEQENLILQQIISQVPGGQEVLLQFLNQKTILQKLTQDRLVRERRELQEHEKLQRQQLLRERAAQRAAIAQFLPQKPEKRAYRRKQPPIKQIQPSTDSTTKVLMAAFMSIVFFTDDPNPRNLNHTVYSSNKTNHFWYIIHIGAYTFGIIYFCLIPITSHLLRPYKVTKKCNKSYHRHYNQDIFKSWDKLYANLMSIIKNNHSSAQHSFRTTYDFVIFSLVLFMPRFLMSIFYKYTKPLGCPEELTYIGAWIRLNEIECLGANPNVTKTSMLHSCMRMLSLLHKMKRDDNYVLYYEANTMARVYATVAIQLELCLPKFISTYTSKYYWNKVQYYLKDTQVVSTSNCYDQVLQMLLVRNGFQQGCTNTSYSYLLSYMTSPLDLILYWQQLEKLQECWYLYLQGNHKHVFSGTKLPASFTLDLSNQLLQCWIQVGLTLESLNHDDLSELNAQMNKLEEHHQNSSFYLIIQHQTMIYHLLEAMVSIKTSTEQAIHCLEKANEYRKASFECMDKISIITNFENNEASVLVLCSIAVHLRTLKLLVQKKASVHYIEEIKDQILHDLDSPFIKSLPLRCKRSIQAVISQIC